MSDKPILDNAQLDAALATMSHWRVEQDALNAAFKFASFEQAMTFMAACALHASRLDHHPDWSNCYDRVQIRLTTHDAGNRITNLDLELARAISNEYDKLLSC